MRWIIQANERADSVIKSQTLALTELYYETLGFVVLRGAASFVGLRSTTSTNDYAVSLIRPRDITASSIILANTDTLWLALTAHHDWLRPAFQYSEQKNFDRLHYGQLDLPLLDRDYEILSLQDDVTKRYTEDRWIQASDDLQRIYPGVLKAGTSVLEYVSRYRRLNEDIGRIIITPLRTTYHEARFVVLDGEVIGGAVYKHQGTPFGCVLRDSAAVWDIAGEYAKLYQPDRLFVMDLATTAPDDKWSIIGYRCFNTANLYSMNHLSVYSSIDHAFR